MSLQEASLRGAELHVPHLEADERASLLRFCHQPLRCVVIVPRQPLASVEPYWEVIFANGSEAEARKAADAWCLNNPGLKAHLLLWSASACASISTNWDDARRGAPPEIGKPSI